MIRNLSYVGFASPHTDDWRHFGPDILGTEMAPAGPDGAVRLRVDEAPWRLAIHPGAENDLLYVGWNVGDATSLESAADTMMKRGFEVTRHQLGDRPASDVVSFFDRFGFRHELAAELPESGSFTPGRPIAGFVTGEQGLGHLVFVVPDLDAALEFYVGVLAMRLSDSVESEFSLRFLHCPGRAARHHTVALAAIPGMVGIHHLMLEVASIDDVGRAYDLARTEGLTMAMDLGRHTNDLMTSFYVRTPSGFEIEYGTGGRRIDDNDWEPTVYDSGDLWGHHPPATGLLLPEILRPLDPTGTAA
jgi:3,4-dihydroxy-9,10-secoandrosta-1,3,5(10)-triene-9,17-dione 4,5-dioxygenase